MAESVWHYSHNDEEHGPITSAQLKSLATAGKLLPDSLVWKEGMAEWVNASQIPGLFAQQASPAAAPPAVAQQAPPASVPQGTVVSPPAEPDSALPQGQSPKTKRGRRNQMGSDQMVQLLTLLGRPILAAGLLLVILAQGLDTLGARKADRCPRCQGKQ